MKKNENTILDQVFYSILVHNGQKWPTSKDHFQIHERTRLIWNEAK